MGWVEPYASDKGRKYRYIWREQGQKRSVSLGPVPKKTADRLMLQLDQVVAQGGNPRLALKRPKNPQSVLTLSALARREQEYMQERFRPRTIQMTLDALEWLKDFLSDIPLHNLSQPDFERYLRWRRETRGNNAKSLNIQLRLLRASFNRARRYYGYTGPDPLADVRPFAESTGSDRVEYLTVEQVADLLETLSRHWPRSTYDEARRMEFVRLIRFYLLTGARCSEALNLTWLHIDATSIQLADPQSRSKRWRRFPIAGELKTLMNELRASTESEYVFPSFTNQRMAVSGRLANAAVATSSIGRRIGTHVLRHTFASHLAMNGVEMVTIGRLLGQSTSHVTELYVHLSPDHLADAVRKLPY